MSIEKTALYTLWRRFSMSFFDKNYLSNYKLSKNMADTELCKAFKDLPFRIQTSSIKERRIVIQLVCDVLSSPDVNEQTVKGLCRAIQTTLYKYGDYTSHSFIVELIQKLVKHHREWMIKYFIPVIGDIAEQQKNLVPTSSTCKTCLYALRWSCTLGEHSFFKKLDDPALSTLVLSQSLLLMGVGAYGNNKKNQKAYSMLHQMWIKLSENCADKWLEIICTAEGPQVPMMMAQICKHLTDLGDTERLNALMEKYKVKVMDIFIKSLISVKLRPNTHLIEGCKYFLRILNEDDFKTVILPALQKAMLRNPEIIIEAIASVVTCLECDLNKFGVDITKNLIANLHSKEESVRVESSKTCKTLATKLSEQEPILAIVKQIFEEFNGSNGKLTLAEHKAGVLLGAGLMAFNAMKIDNKYMNVYAEVSKHFYKALESETHEKTLCYCLEMLTHWSTKIVGELPESIVDAFKKGIGLKTTTQLVKISYLQWLGRCLENNVTVSTKSKESLIPILLKIVEKAIQQPLQTAVVGEGICALYLLLKFHDKTEFPSKHSGMWNALVSNDKSIFLQEKFITSTSDDILTSVVYVCQELLAKYSNDVEGKSYMIYRALIHCALSSNKNTSAVALNSIKYNLVNGPKQSQIARSLINSLALYLETLKIPLKSSNAVENGTDTSPEVTSKSVIATISSICSYKDYQLEDKQLLAVDSILACHHPIVVSINPTLWLKIVRFLELQPKQLISLFANNLKNSYIAGFQCNMSYSNVVRTMVSQNPDAILPNLVQYVTEILENQDLLKITRDEYFTYLTPEGELYDKSMIPGNEDNTEMNMKRESKAYSFKEQLEEEQLRRELEERKRLEGKGKQAKELTPKQKEAIKLQTIKENAIRDKLTAFEERLKCMDSMLVAGSSGDPQSFGKHAAVIMKCLLAALRSPLAAPRVSNLVLNLRKVFWPVDLSLLGDTIAHVTLRLYKPQCDLDANWEAENVKNAISRTIELLYSRTCFRNKYYNEQLALGQVSPSKVKDTFLNAPAFCYCFNMLRLSLTSQFAKADEKMVQEGLHIISLHSKLRSSVDLAVDLNHPSLLPIRQMFQLLLEVISRTHGKLQIQSSMTLYEVATAVSGEEGCGVATMGEIECLLSGLQSPSEVVRDASLRALTCLTNIFPSLTEDQHNTILLTKRLWIAKFDTSEENQSVAQSLWESCDLEKNTKLSPTEDESNRLAAKLLLKECISEVTHPVEAMQRASAAALADLLAMDPSLVTSTLDTLLKIYKQKLTMIPPKLDEFGHVIEKPIDEWGGRRGVALALTALSPLLSGDDCVAKLVQFFVSNGLGDRAEDVRKEMFNAAMSVVDLHGKDTVSDQLPVFEQFLDKAPKTSSFDIVRQAVVILIGSLARHLSPEDPRIQPITLRLIAALSTPSQQVQEAVGNCLPHLITSPVLRDETTNIVNKLMQKLLKAEKYGDRRGAAYGLAGVVKGLGILALKQLDIMTRLTEAIQDKKNFKHREGALFAFEMLCTKLGRLFEPYIVHVLPHLLLCFGDSSQYVRTATDDCAKVVMSKLSAHGVKLVLPSLLTALEDDNWRTKTGSIELLGAMAFCAPKQLSSCLPSIVPKLIEVLSDSHVKVQEAGADALKVIGSVIRNPEIQAIVPPLLEALQDPSNKTSACLQTLLDTQFVHFIDAPSLALIMPVVQRAFMDRSTETRKMAAQIIGNMYSLTDQKDLMPYLPNIIPGLKQSLLDPVPEVRSVSARALGAMVRGMGETSFEDLLPWLMQTLTSETSSVDRSGAAQGLSEVVAGLGVEKLHKLMPDIIATSERTDIAPHVKDGYIMMFIYMPGAFTNEFTPYIGQIINPILKALADENEYVRDTALKAGQRIVNLYADSAITLLLPELEKGLFDDDWRIRYSSVQLLGDLLYRISGVSGKMSTETASEDDNFGTEQSHSAIMVALGQERRNRVLAGLYMGRSDVALMVRQAALHVWKVVVTNTPRTLREILPTLFGLLLGCLASTSFDKRQVAARTLGDLVRKLGERVLPEIIPILEGGLQSERADQRQGVCIGLSEIMASTSKEMVLLFVHSLVPTVKKALCDPLPEVRCAAAKTFDSLHATVGVKALDDILPPMLHALNDPDPKVEEATLDGLRQIMAIKSRVVLPYLVPQLCNPPNDQKINTKALSILASVAGDSLTKYLHKILPALLSAMCNAQGTPDEVQELEYCRAVVLSVSDEAGVRAIMDALLEGSRSTSSSQRRAAATLLAAFCSHTRADFTHYIPQLLRGLLHLFADPDHDVLLMAWEALQAVTKSMDAEQQIQHVSDVRQAVRFAVSDLKGADLLPGFCLPKGITPILPLFRESILNGLPEDKEAAALMLGEVIRLTSAPALQPSVVHITGPLIRILGDRFNASVKAAVLETLALLLEKVGVMLKQFLPQLQTTFLKALNDPNRQVRIKAGYALSQLVVIHTRADPLFIEIHNGIKNSEDLTVKETMLQALRSIIVGGGEKMSETLALSVLTTLSSTSLLGHSEDPPRSAVGGCLGVLLHFLPSHAKENILLSNILSEDNVDWTLKHGRSCALFVGLKDHPDTLFIDQFKDKICKSLLSCLTSDKVPVVCNGIRGIGYLLKYLQCNQLTIPQILINPFVRTMNHSNNDVKQLLARVCTMLGKTIPSVNMAPELLKVLLPTLVNGTKEKNGYVKANSEIALISVLRLREGEEVQQRCQQLLEVGASESLNDVISKVLKKSINQPEGKDEELDSTLIT